MSCAALDSFVLSLSYKKGETSKKLGVFTCLLKSSCSIAPAYENVM